MSSISPLDGRYAENCPAAHAAFSESAMAGFRVELEVEWFTFLIGQFHGDGVDYSDLTRWRKVALKPDKGWLMLDERKTHHDVKSVENWVRYSLEEFPALRRHANLAHALLTSDDTTTYALNRAFAVWRQHAHESVFGLIRELSGHVRKHADSAMLGRTHGQPATPTTWGRDLSVPLERAMQYWSRVQDFLPVCKLSGAVGNFAAHRAAYPEVDWVVATNIFADQVGMRNSLFTTQVEPKDNLIFAFDAVEHMSQVLMNLARNVWLKTSQGLVRTSKPEGATGSSTMPHKTNPIHFENAEGNFAMAIANLRAIKDKVFESRDQRDLSDSTVLRNVGVALGYFEVAVAAMRRGFQAAEFNSTLAEMELDDHYEVLAEPVQQVLRRRGYDDAYERVKREFSWAAMSRAQYIKAVGRLGLPAELSQEISAWMPHEYTGLSGALVRLQNHLHDKFMKADPDAPNTETGSEEPAEPHLKLVKD